MSDNKKYYYLKLKETFFDSEEMKILESMKNGIEYQNLYFRLCLLSLKSEGLLVFKNIIPYDLDMLSTVLRVSIDTVKTGIEIFKKIQLVSEMDNGVLFMTDIQSLIGQSSTEAERIKAYREKTKQLQCTENVQMYGNCTPELELKKEIKIDREINTANSAKPRQTFIKPTLQEITEYCQERSNTVDPQKFLDYYSSNGWKVGRNSMKDWKAAVRTWEKNTSVQPQKKETGYRWGQS